MELEFCLYDARAYENKMRVFGTVRKYSNFLIFFLEEALQFA